MEPDYHDGDTVFIRECVEVRDGDLGIFVLDNQCYFKMLHIDRKEHRAYPASLNNDDEDIPIFEDSNIKTLGEILGRWSEDD